MSRSLGHSTCSKTTGMPRTITMHGLILVAITAAEKITLPDKILIKSLERVM